MPINEQLLVFDDIVPYAAISFADAYFAQQLSKRRFWATLEDDDASKAADKLGALREATCHLDALFWVGHRLEIGPSQREWPRYIGFGTYGDIYYLEFTIPVQIAQACAEQAYYIARNVVYGADVDARLDHQAQGINSITRVGASESANLGFARRDNISPYAKRLIQPFIQKTGNLNKGYRTPYA